MLCLCGLGNHDIKLLCVETSNNTYTSYVLYMVVGFKKLQRKTTNSKADKAGRDDTAHKLNSNNPLTALPLHPLFPPPPIS